MSRKVIALILMSTITCCLLSGCKSASLTVSDKNDETKSEKDADEEDAEKYEEKSEETYEKEEEEKETDEAQSTEGYDLHSALSGQEFELSSMNPYDSNYRTWIEFIDDDRYVFAYVVEVHSASEVIDAETAYMALGSLTFSGREDEISCAGGTDGEPYTELLIYCLRGQGQSLLGDEVEFVFEDDTDKIEEYGLDPDDFYNDYQIGGYDSVYDEYDISSQCVIYVQYAPDGMHRFLTIEEFNSYVPEYDIEGGRLMNIVLDKDGKVILIKEPYTP